MSVYDSQCSLTLFSLCVGRFYHLTHIRTAARMFWNLCVVYPGVFIQLLDLKLIVPSIVIIYTMLVVRFNNVNVPGVVCSPDFVNVLH